MSPTRFRASFRFDKDELASSVLGNTAEIMDSANLEIKINKILGLFSFEMSPGEIYLICSLALVYSKAYMLKSCY
jgi:hypothetical protein